MKKICFALLVLLSLINSAWAAQNKNGLRDLAADEIFRYAENLYNRKDYTAATEAFQHLLAIQPDRKGALAYLQKMQQPVPVCCGLPIAKSVAKPLVITAQAPIINPNETNADIKGEIAAEDAAIDQLTQELAQLRAQGENSSHAQE